MKNKLFFYLMLFVFVAGCNSDSNSDDFGVDGVAATDVSLNINAITLAPGDSYTLTAVAEPENANQNVSWASSAPGVVTVDYTGRVTAVSTGVAYITATTISGNQTATCVVTVDTANGNVTAVSLEWKTVRLRVGDDITLTPSIFPSNAEDPHVTWDSDNSDVASVTTDGVVTAHAAGIAEIIVTTRDGGHTASCTVFVGDAPTNVTLNTTTLILPISEKKGILVAIFAPSNAVANVTWSSDNTAVATVSSTGEVSAITAGMANITAKTVDDEITATCVVTVLPLEMVFVQGGTFTMGSSSGSSDERPTHQVTLSSYSIGKYPVTQAQWVALMGSNPSHFRKVDDYPVESVSWDDAYEFIRRLNALTDLNFRLPTEAEWEYAARGGNQSEGFIYSGSNNIDEVAWYYNINSALSTAPVGTKAPNELGIYDMSGNVTEWCNDWYGAYNANAKTNPTGTAGGAHRILRGGSWTGSNNLCRVSYRTFNLPIARNNWYGFRLALP